MTQNVETDLDIANGARGEIVDIKLDPKESDHENGSRVVLAHLPAYILVKMMKTRTSQLDGLEPSVILVEPTRSPKGLV